MNNSISCSDGRWYTRADALLCVEGIHVSSVTVTGMCLVLGVETGDDVTGFRTAASLPWAMDAGGSAS